MKKVGRKREGRRRAHVRTRKRKRESERAKERGGYGVRGYIYPRGVIVVRCMVIGRLAASILTTREPQITRKLKLPPYQHSCIFSTFYTRLLRFVRTYNHPHCASIRWLNTLLESYMIFPRRASTVISKMSIRKNSARSYMDLSSRKYKNRK